MTNAPAYSPANPAFWDGEIYNAAAMAAARYTDRPALLEVGYFGPHNRMVNRPTWGRPALEVILFTYYLTLPGVED